MKFKLNGIKQILKYLCGNDKRKYREVLHFFRQLVAVEELF
jgi:hypothetical protein